MSFLSMRRASMASAATIMVATLAVAACGGTNTEDSSDGSDSTLNIAVQGDITTYDPWSSQSGFNGSLFSNVALYDALVHLDTDGNAVPWLVTEWESADSSHYTLTLRDDVTFSDGTALNAEAVVKNFEYAAVASTPGECNDYVAGVTATATDETTVEIALDAPSVGFMTDLGTCAGFIVNPTALEDPTTLKTTPAGSGPYILDEENSVAGQKWIYHRNADYWSSDTYPFDTFNLIYYADSTAAANAAQSGQIDLIQSVDPSTDTSGLDTLLTSTDFRGLYIMDTTGALSEPLSDKRVRQAMQYAIDRENVTNNLYAESGVISYSSPFTEEQDGYSDALASTFSYDLEKAKALLAEAGYADGFTVKAMVVTSIYGDAAQVIASDLSKIGITLELENHDSDFFEQLTSGQWPMTTFNFSIGTNAIHTYENLVAEDGFWNILNSTSEEIPALLESLNTAADDAARTAILEQVALAFQTESWYLVPTFVRSATAYDSDKLTVGTIAGAPVPYLYDIQKVG